MFKARVADGDDFPDAGAGTWHCLVQLLKSDGPWNIDRFTLGGANPTARFAVDIANPTVKMFPAKTGRSAVSGRRLSPQAANGNNCWAIRGERSEHLLSYYSAPG